jgi:hypothetical protein
VSNPPRLRDFLAFQRPAFAFRAQPGVSEAEARLSRPESAARAAPRGRLEDVQEVLTADSTVLLSCPGRCLTSLAFRPA